VALEKALPSSSPARAVRIAVNYRSSADLADETVEEITALGVEAFAVGADVSVSPHDLILFPNRGHGFGSEPYMVRRRWDYFVRHLLGAEPPPGYELRPAQVPPTP